MKLDKSKIIDIVVFPQKFGVKPCEVCGKVKPLCSVAMDDGEFIHACKDCAGVK